MAPLEDTGIQILGPITGNPNALAPRSSLELLRQPERSVQRNRTLRWVPWPDDVDAADFYAMVRDALMATTAGGGDFAPAACLGRLRRALKASVAARRGDDQALSGSRVREVLHGGLVITDAGLEQVGHGILRSWADIARLGFDGQAPATAPLVIDALAYMRSLKAT
jgi:hypothetical protein